MFKVGDKIVYPLHGAGIIESIVTKEVLGVNKDYFVLKLPQDKLKIMLPLDNIQNLGLRSIENPKFLDVVYEILEERASAMPSNWNKRYRENFEKVKSGDLCEVAEVVRNLMLKDKSRGLSSGEKRMLDSTKQILISEVAMIKGYDWTRAEEEINSHILKAS